MAHTVHLRLTTLILATLAVGAAVAVLAQPAAVPGPGAEPLTTLRDVQLAANSYTTGYTRYLAVSGFTGGDSLSDAHRGTAEIDQLRFGIAAAAKARLDPVVITKTLDAYSPQFARAAATGQVLATVTVYVRRTSTSAQRDIATFVLSGVRVSRQVVAATGDEQVTLAATQERMSYTTQSATGGSGQTYTFCFNQGTGRTC